MRVDTWPGELHIAHDTEAASRASPSLCWCPYELAGAARKIGAWEILMPDCLEVSHRNHSTWLSVVSVKGNSQALPLGLMDQKRGCYQCQQVNIKSTDMHKEKGEMLLSDGLLSCCFQQIYSVLHFST